MVQSAELSMTALVMHSGLPPQQAPIVVAETANTFLLFLCTCDTHYDSSVIPEPMPWSCREAG